MESFKSRFSRNFEEMLKQELIGKSVMTTYNRRIYRVDKIEFNMNPRDGFTNDQGEKIQFLDYY